MLANFLAVYGGGVALGIVIGLKIQKYRGPPVRWVQELTINEDEQGIDRFKREK